MSGICAVWRKQSPGRVADTLASIQAGLSIAKEERFARESEQGAGVGVSARFEEQQIYKDDGVLLACDAELLNEKELWESLGRKPEGDAGKRTAALMAQLYARFGSGFVEKLRGGFSVVLWDWRERRMLAAIDGFGIKRLAYYQDEKVLLIGTRVDALARTGDADLKINPRAIVNVLNFSANLAPETIFAKIQRLVPGVVLVAANGQVRLEKYWDMRYGLTDGSDEAWLSRELESVVERSVAAHCKDDSFSGLGAFLSGGTDSSTVVGM